MGGDFRVFLETVGSGDVFGHVAGVHLVTGPTVGDVGIAPFKAEGDAVVRCRFDDELVHRLILCQMRIFKQFGAVKVAVAVVVGHVLSAAVVFRHDDFRGEVVL